MKNTVKWAICMLTTCSIIQMAFPADSTTVHETVAPFINSRDMNRVSVDTKDLLKKGPVILWFWNSCCGFKKPQVRMLKSLYHSYHREGLTVLAVNEDDSKKSAGITMSIKQNQLPFTIIFDNNGDIIRMFHTISVPSVYVIGQDGNLVYSQNGYIAGDEKILEKKVNALFVNNEKDK